MRKLLTTARLTRAGLTTAGLSAAAVLTVAACSSSSSSSAAAAPASSAPASSALASSAPASAAASGGTVSATAIGGTQVLAGASGLTLYWFAPDTPTASKCSGSCATFWPPVKGPVTAGAGVTGQLGTITRADGTQQATYDGHPLYTFAGDSGPGQAKGNAVNANGGLWYEMTVSGATPAASASAAAATKMGGY
jgi:predicted lipoprotein with Yx(FWY)xxD motif